MHVLDILKVTWDFVTQASASSTVPGVSPGRGYINSTRLFTPEKAEALAKSGVHQRSRALVTIGVEWVVITDLKNLADCHE
jgi:hypothetical protein